jgi:hypothetical protein
MNPRSVSSLFAAACVAAASAAHALPLGDRASFEFFAGGDVSTPGSFRGPMNSPASDGPTSFDRLAFDDMYRSNYSGGAELDYAFDSHLSTFGRAAYSRFNGESREIGATFTDDLGRVPIEARFANTHTRELDLGTRYTFGSSEERLRPFVGAALGATWLAGTSAEVANPVVTASPSTRVELGRASTVFQQRVETGLQFSPVPNLDLRLTAAANHVGGGRGADDPNLGLLGLDNSNSVMRAHWDYPAELGAVWHF